MSVKWRVLVATGPFLKYGKVHDYIGSDDRYDVAITPVDDAVQTLALGGGLLPHLCVVEWSGKDAYDYCREVISQCRKQRVQVLAVVARDELLAFTEEPFKHSCQFILMPVDKAELLARVALELGVPPNPLAPGSVKIDGELAINFDYCVVRRGVNNYIKLSVESTMILHCLYDNINKWVTSEELGKSFGEDSDISNKAVIKHIHNIRNAIEDDNKKPRYVLNNRHKMYMLHSKDYPQVDSILGFGKTFQEAKRSK